MQISGEEIWNKQTKTHGQSPQDTAGVEGIQRGGC